MKQITDYDGMLQRVFEFLVKRFPETVLEAIGKALKLPLAFFSVFLLLFAFIFLNAL